jgi:hypothetical protein
LHRLIIFPVVDPVTEEHSTIYSVGAVLNGITAASNKLHGAVGAGMSLALKFRVITLKLCI